MPLRCQRSGTVIMWHFGYCDFGGVHNILQRRANWLQHVDNHNVFMRRRCGMAGIDELPHSLSKPGVPADVDLSPVANYSSAMNV